MHAQRCRCHFGGGRNCPHICQPASSSTRAHIMCGGGCCCCSCSKRAAVDLVEGGTQATADNINIDVKTHTHTHSSGHTGQQKDRRGGETTEKLDALDSFGVVFWVITCHLLEGRASREIHGGATRPCVSQCDPSSVTPSLPQIGSRFRHLTFMMPRVACMRHPSIHHSFIGHASARRR